MVPIAASCNSNAASAGTWAVVPKNGIFPPGMPTGLDRVDGKVWRQLHQAAG